MTIVGMFITLIRRTLIVTALEMLVTIVLMMQMRIRMMLTGTVLEMCATIVDVFPTLAKRIPMVMVLEMLVTAILKIFTSQLEKMATAKKA